MINLYSGSCGTSSTSGCLSVTTFNYRVYPVISNDDESLSIIVAEHFLILPWDKGGAKINLTRVEFNNSVEGLNLARKWLLEELEKSRIYR